MKTLFTGILLAVATYSGTPTSSGGIDKKLEMQLKADEVFETRVKIFDYQGNLIKEMKTKDVANDDISIADYLVLESSDFAFQHLGDYYYFRN